jgi:outer membrane protein TolC
MNFLHASLLTAMLFGSVTSALAAPLSLPECLKMARSHNPELQNAAWESRIASDGKQLATASTFPRLDAQAGYTMQLEPQAVKMLGITAETQDANFAYLGIAATYTLYDFGRRDARINQADTARNVAVSSYHHLAGNVALQVVDAYFRLLEADKLAHAASEEIAQIGEHRRMAQVLFEEGVVTRNDVLQADLRLANAQQKLLTLTNRRENGWLLLNFLTGAEPDFRGDLDDSTTLTEPTSEGVNLNKRFDIKAQQQLVELRNFEVKENRENYFPELFARLGMDYVQNDKVREQAIYSATLGLKVNLFDGFASQAARERSVKQRSRQHDALRLAEQRAGLEVASARNDVTVAKERISVAKAAIKQGLENLRINQERYQERVGIASEVLDAQTLLTQAKTDYYRAIYDHQTATARLLNALGEL